MKPVLPLALVAALALAPAAAGAPAGTARNCGVVAITPNSDDIASGIVARGVTCRYARRFVRAARGRPGRRFRDFRCTKRDLGTPLSSWRYRCTKGTKLIRWTKT